MARVCFWTRAEARQKISFSVGAEQKDTVLLCTWVIPRNAGTADIELPVRITVPTVNEFLSSQVRDVRQDLLVLLVPNGVLAIVRFDERQIPACVCQQPPILREKTPPGRSS